MKKRKKFMGRRPSGQPKIKPESFRPTARVKALLDLAVNATGADKTEIVLRCLDAQLPRIVEEAHVEGNEKRKKALEEFRKQHKILNK